LQEQARVYQQEKEQQANDIRRLEDYSEQLHTAMLDERKASHLQRMEDFKMFKKVVQDHNQRILQSINETY